MNLLVINQHTRNHGDEAAATALYRTLLKEPTVGNIMILYSAKDLLPTEQFISNNPDIKHYGAAQLTFLDKMVMLLSFILPMPLLRSLIRKSSLSTEFALIDSADKVVNAPTGVNIGPYQDWLYLWRLYVAIKLFKPVAIYSISFGPLSGNPFFRQISTQVLRSVNFISLRDHKSYQYAEEFRISFVPSIDTAFLDDTYLPIIHKSYAFLQDLKYAVLVPHQLYQWHPSFRNLNHDCRDYLDRLYVDIINLLVSRNFYVVMLPQLYGRNSDVPYFKYLKSCASNGSKVIILPNELNSDVQQYIIRHATLAVGARYHSIIFAIRNCTPFYSLSYEHKMTNMLTLLSLDKHDSSIIDLIRNRKITHVMESIKDLCNGGGPTTSELSRAAQKAKIIAQNTYKKFQMFLYK